MVLKLGPFAQSLTLRRHPRTASYGGVFLCWQEPSLARSAQWTGGEEGSEEQQPGRASAAPADSMVSQSHARRGAVFGIHACIHTASVVVKQDASLTHKRFPDEQQAGTFPVFHRKWQAAVTGPNVARGVATCVTFCFKFLLRPTGLLL